MDTKKIEKYKAKLLEEKEILEKDLSTVGKKNPNNPADWEAETHEENIDTADRNNVADEITDYENNVGISKQLESRLSEVNMALGKIESNTYGKCEVAGELIEEDRLNANPAARTCKKHINEKV